MPFDVKESLLTKKELKIAQKDEARYSVTWHEKSRKKLNRTRHEQESVTNYKERTMNQHEPRETRTI